MQVTLQSLLPSEQEGSIVVDTTPQSTVHSLVAAYCSQKGIPFNKRLVIFDSKRNPLSQYSTLASMGISNGSTLAIGFKDKTYIILQKWVVYAMIAALVIGAIAILTLSLLYALSGGRYPFGYGVVMDAGSSKTNTIVYKWRGDKHKGTGCVTQEDNCYSKGGIAKMDPLKLDEVINCAKNITKIVEAEYRMGTPLYFAATAGMRLLNITDSNKVEAILDQLYHQLGETGLSVRNIDIITGTDEGVYGWITANFLRETLEEEQKFNPWVPTTFGALDMGGASMQISYALPPTDDKHDKSEVREMMLYGQTHNVYSRSNLCFGRDEAQRRYRSLLIQNPDIKTPIVDPCLPDGYTVKDIDGASLFDLPCTQNDKTQRWIKDNPSILTKMYSFTGGDSTYCRGNVSYLLNETFCSKMGYNECFRKMDNLLEDQKYLAFASYFYTTSFLNATKSSLEGYVTAMNDFCSKTYDEVKKISKSPYAVEYCFNAHYIHQVLLNGFGFKSSTWKNLEFVGKIAGKDVSWSLGYMINATNLLPQRKPLPRLLSPVCQTFLLLIFILVVLGAAVFLFQTLYRKDQKSSSTYNSA